MKKKPKKEMAKPKKEKLCDHLKSSRKLTAKDIDRLANVGILHTKLQAYHEMKSAGQNVPNTFLMDGAEIELIISSLAAVMRSVPEDYRAAVMKVIGKKAESILKDLNRKLNCQCARCIQGRKTGAILDPEPEGHEFVAKAKKPDDKPTLH